MYNKRSLFAVIIMAVLIFAVSCNKQTLTKTDNPNKQNNYDKMITQRIEHFRQTMQKGYKTGTSMPLDSAVWNLEALITNYSAYPDSASQDFILKNAHFTISVDANGYVTQSDVQALYQRMLDTINAQLTEINSDVKFLAFSDVQQDSVAGTTAYITSNNGYGFNLILGIYQNFTDDWIWGTLSNPDEPPYAGNCSGTDFSSDGSNEIQYRLNHPVVTGQGTAYTDLETREATGDEFRDENDNPRLYWDVTHDAYHCMDIDELTDNLINADNIIKTYDDIIDPNTGYPMGIRPHGKDFVRVQIIDDMIPGGANFYPYLHHYYVTYGIPYIINR